MYSFTTDCEWDRTKSGVQWCAACWAQEPNKEKIIFVGHAVTNTYITLRFLYRVLHNDTYVFTRFINNNTLSTTMPGLGWQNLSKIKKKNTFIVPTDAHYYKSMEML